MSLDNWRFFAIGFLSATCVHLLCGIIRVLRSAVFKRDLKKLREQRRREQSKKRQR